MPDDHSISSEQSQKNRERIKAEDALRLSRTPSWEMHRRPNPAELARDFQTRVNDIRDIASNLRSLAHSLSGDEAEKAAADLLSLADNLTSAADTYGLIFKKAYSEATVKGIEKAGSSLMTLNVAYNSVNVIRSLGSTKALEEFKADPMNPDRAKAWSVETVRSFSATKELLGALPLDFPFISDMIGGYLSAPANYVAAFNRELEGYTQRIDERGFISSDSNQSAVEGEKVTMKGPLSKFYIIEKMNFSDFGLHDLMNRNMNKLNTKTLAEAIERIENLVLENEGWNQDQKRQALDRIFEFHGLPPRIDPEKVGGMDMVTITQIFLNQTPADSKTYHFNNASANEPASEREKDDKSPSQAPPLVLPGRSAL